MKLSNGSECFHVQAHPVVGRYAGLRCYSQPVCFFFPLRSVQAHHEEPQEHRSFQEDALSLLSLLRRPQAVLPEFISQTFVDIQV